MIPRRRCRYEPCRSGVLGRDPSRLEDSSGKADSPDKRGLIGLWEPHDIAANTWNVALRTAEPLKGFGTAQLMTDSLSASAPITQLPLLPDGGNEPWPVVREAIADEYAEPHSYPWIVGFSGGKDSTVVCHLVIEHLLAHCLEARGVGASILSRMIRLWKARW
jgi:hypothetical protein